MDQSNKVIPFPVKGKDAEEDTQEDREIRVVRVSRRMWELFELDDEKAEESPGNGESVTENDEV